VVIVCNCNVRCGGDREKNEPKIEALLESRGENIFTYVRYTFWTLSCSQSFFAKQFYYLRFFHTWDFIPSTVQLCAWDTLVHGFNRLLRGRPAFESQTCNIFFLFGWGEGVESRTCTNSIFIGIGRGAAKLRWARAHFNEFLKIDGSAQRTGA